MCISARCLLVLAYIRPVFRLFGLGFCSFSWSAAVVLPMLYHSRRTLLLLSVSTVLRDFLLPCWDLFLFCSGLVVCCFRTKMILAYSRLLTVPVNSFVWNYLFRLDTRFGRPFCSKLFKWCWLTGFRYSSRLLDWVSVYFCFQLVFFFFLFSICLFIFFWETAVFVFLCRTCCVCDFVCGFLSSCLSFLIFFLINLNKSSQVNWLDSLWLIAYCRTEWIVSSFGRVTFISSLDCLSSWSIGDNSNCLTFDRLSLYLLANRKWI